jgi:cyclophilin family peptidyl-prolyl cis-trans isomerase
MDPDEDYFRLRPQSPEDVARTYYRTYGDFFVLKELPWWRRPLVWLVAGIVAGGAALCLVVANQGSVPSHSGSNLPTRVEVLQARANRMAANAGCPANPKTSVNPQRFAAPDHVVRPHTLYAATVTTTAGVFRMSLDVVRAPQASNSFVFLAEKGYYNCNAFFRVTRGGLDVTGDPTETGQGGPGYSTTDNRPDRSRHPADPYPLGSIVLRQRGTTDGGGSQWFVVAGPHGEALPDDDLFGRVLAGWSVVERINAQGTADGTPTVTERILSVTIQTQKV